MKIVVALLILAIAAAALLASHQRTPLPLRIDAQAPLPRYASASADGSNLVCMRVHLPGQLHQKRIVRA